MSGPGGYTDPEVRVYAVNGVDLLRLDEVNLHEHVQAPGEEPLPPLPGLEVMVDQGSGEYLTIQLDMDGVANLRRYLQRLERKVKGGSR